MKCYGKQIVNIHSTALGNERTRLLGQYSRQLRLDADRFYAVEIARSMADWQWTGEDWGLSPHGKGFAWARTCQADTRVSPLDSSTRVKVDE